MASKTHTKTRPALALAALGSMISLPAIAADSNWYATANIGLGTLSSSTLTYDDGTITESVDTDFDASFTGGGTLGYNISDTFSVETEIMYRRNEFDGANLPSLGAFDGGDFASLGFGVNILYRFPLGSSGEFSGYAGPGFFWLQEIDIDFDSAGEQEVSFETDDSSLQFKFGGRYKATERWFLEAGATYLTASDVTMELGGSANETLTSDYDHWAFSIGVGLSF